ncbi:MAG: ATP-binding cassette domain-containing protein [Phycisphaerales bacterium]|nr:ATP-binding cassette domain-containing protein [Phycisphaerales bacterium]
MATVQLRAVSKSYGSGAAAVKSVDLAVADGEFVVLVGPSGCGKSTTLRMIAGLEDLTDGTISIGERVVNDVAPKDRDIAMVFQNYALYPHLNVRQNLSFGLERRRAFKSRWRGIFDSSYRTHCRAEHAAIVTRVESAACTLGIEQLLHRQPRELSGGQRQRVAVGRALVRDPAVFLFDEPLSNLDALLRGEMRTELRILHRALRATMIYVTHDQEEAMSLADRIVVMKDGIVQQIASPAEIYERPANRFVAGFIGTPPMNMIDGTLTSAADGTLTFRAACCAFTLPGDRWNLTGLSGSGARAVTLGIRPERLALTSDQSTNAATLTGKVVATERYGACADVVFVVDGIRLISRAPQEQTVRIREGDTTTMSIDLHAAQLFDSTTGCAIARRAELG